ncbi:MAG: 30S ribosomal protein S1 [Phycisphaerae bacterium]
MVDKNLIADLELDDLAAERMVAEAYGQTVADGDMDGLLGDQLKEYKSGSILTGKIIGNVGDSFLVEIGLKSEGVLERTEFDAPDDVEIGDSVEVLLEELESETGTITISKRKADRIRGWQRIVERNKEGDTVEGKVMRKIKGGLLVDIGVPVFLPASQVDIRRPGDIGDFIGQTVRAQIIKIDTERRNIVVSRRKLIEDERAAQRKALLSTLKEGDVVKGTVKNIADFGAFIDLGGIDGLLHITDMSWDRIEHPSQMLKIDQQVEVMVLNVDREKEKIALGLKQKSENPWERVAERYPVGTRISGEVVNIVNYGAFVKLEPGIEGLVHISEMSWTRRINHPSEVVTANQKVDVVVLEVNKDKQEISLGMKQTEVNPWTQVAQKYPMGTVVAGTVRNLTNYGAFVEIEEGIDGLLHVSDMSWTKKVSHPSEMLKKGDELRCVVLSVDQEKMRVALGLKQMHEDPWVRAVPERYQPGMVVRGKITKITNFGVFVELEPDLEGLLHVSELADHKVENPQDEVKIGDEVDVKILRVDTVERKIGLSKKRADWSGDGSTGAESDAKPKREKKLRGGLGVSEGEEGGGRNLISM